MLHIRFKLWRQDNYLGKRKFIKSPITAMNTNINGDQVNLFMVSSPWLENTKSHLFTDVVQKLSGDIKDWTIQTKFSIDEKRQMKEISNMVENRHLCDD